MFKYYVIVFILCLLAIFMTEPQAKPEPYYQCRTEPMIVRIVDNGEVKFIAATSSTTWIYGPADWYMADEARQAHLGRIYADVIQSENKMLLSVDCQ